MLEIGWQYENVKNYFPDTEREIKRLSRGYVVKILSAKIGEPFSKWMDIEINKRN